MKIRSKLLLIYGLMIAALLIMGAFCIWAIVGWSGAAARLSDFRAQSYRAERLRANIYLQVDHASDFLVGNLDAHEEFMNAHERASRLLKELVSHSITQTERDHIEGLEETQFELVWIMNKFFESGRDNNSQWNLPRAQERLREIAGEVEDDIGALNQHYRAQEKHGLAAATKAGSFTVWIIIITAVMALIQFGLLVFLLQRWLVRPIAAVNDAAKTISGGNLDVQISLSSRDEWGQLSGAVNEMAKSLKVSRQKLRDQERLAVLGEIAAYAAHNIRNPLASIRAAGQVILDGPNSLDVETAQSINETIETVDRLDAWLKRLLEFARPLQAEYKTADINQLVTEAVSLAQKPFAQSRVELEWQLATDLPPVAVDDILLEQAIVAIATNAFQAVPKGGRVKVATAYSPGEDNADGLTIRISDNGIGIPNHLQPKLFRIFVSSKDGGTGLGLAQAKRIVDIHNGKITIESSPGKGTTVTIRLPVQNKASGQVT